MLKRIKFVFVLVFMRSSNNSSYKYYIRTNIYLSEIHVKMLPNTMQHALAQLLEGNKRG